ncbi:putative F0F1-ATPase subunit (Ca2+/Mg2+ transporter) [Natranaerovirga hydrolytica]|uniref:Putative F0F1-ATPase subunit (Ca2+/Mg2+ transporter) n=1 Tax=Natranaerovirga hydrolytica TaxID=680378 RepID=A0A4R1M6N2_9FIRM|nr:AtpZ/AtpI family protein [Natranaerovirga hydrolytica]TCK87908.1 putative F0F1-ATPase subunit (Ca2+/Mg2+ transporter) [Natranaerovirga hydrolytica]
MDPKVLKYLVLLNQIALVMMIPILFGIFFGKWLDEKLNANGIVTVIFIILGLMAAMRNLFVITTKFFNKDS